MPYDFPSGGGSAQRSFIFNRLALSPLQLQYIKKTQVHAVAAKHNHWLLILHHCSNHEPTIINTISGLIKVRMSAQKSFCFNTAGISKSVCGYVEIFHWSIRNTCANNWLISGIEGTFGLSHNILESLIRPGCHLVFFFSQLHKCTSMFLKVYICGQVPCSLAVPCCSALTEHNV